MPLYTFSKRPLKIFLFTTFKVTAKSSNKKMIFAFVKVIIFIFSKEQRRNETNIQHFFCSVTKMYFR